jgi:hypothetical protein
MEEEEEEEKKRMCTDSPLATVETACLMYLVCVLPYTLDIIDHRTRHSKAFVCNIR